jgi:hypothetical protein
MQIHSACRYQAASGAPFGAVLSIRSQDAYSKARACPRRRRSSVCRQDACITYDWHKEQAACMLASSRDPIRLQRLRFALSHVRTSGRAFAIRMCRIWRLRPAHTADQCSRVAADAGLMSDGRRSEPRSHHIAGLLEVECEGLGAICIAQKTHGRPNRTEYGHIGAR